MKLDIFIKNKLNEEGAGIGYGWTSPYRSVVGVSGDFGREFVQVYDKLSPTGKQIYDTILAVVTKLGEAGSLGNSSEESVETAKKIISFYTEKYNVLNSFVSRALTPLVLLSNTMKDPQPYPPVSKEDNHGLYIKYMEVGFNPHVADILKTDAKLVKEIVGTLYSLRNYHYLFPAGKITAKLQGRVMARKAEQMGKIKDARANDLGEVIVDTVKSIEIGDKK